MKKEDILRIIDVLSEVVKAPYQVLQSLVSYQYRFVKLPEVLHSNDNPPIEIREKAEVIPIDQYLGLYEPEKTKITIFNKGIERASRIINCKPEVLKQIVKLHEWSHALIHIGFEETQSVDVVRMLSDEKYWKEWLRNSTQIYLSIDKRLHEHLAQLLTYYSLNTILKNARCAEAKRIINCIINTFLELNKRQPPEYKVDNYFNVPQSRVIKSISLLKKGWIKGVFEAWSTVIKW